jgi:hypothetical protein
MYKMFNVLGYPDEESWSLGWKQMMVLGVKANRNEGKARINLKEIMHNCDPCFIEIV